MADTRHQCRWCAELCYGDVAYCMVKKKTMSEQATKRVNKCKGFAFCNIDVYTHEKYKPRTQHMKQVEGQMRMEEVGGCTNVFTADAGV